MANVYSEVRNDYYDEESHFTAIDAWIGDEDEGMTIAVVHDSGDVWYIDNGARYNDEVNKAIDEVKARLANK